MKVPRKISDKVASRVAAGQKKVIEDAAKYNLVSPSEGIGGIGDNADQAYRAKTSQADNLINDYANKNPDNKVDPVEEIYEPVMKDLFGPGSDIPSSDRKAGAARVIDIMHDQAEHGYLNNKPSGVYSQGSTQTEPIPLDKVVDLKRDLNADKRLFQKGVANIKTDPLDLMIREKLYQQAVKVIEQHVPEAAQLNREARDIRFVRDASDEALNRIQKTNIGLGSLPDLIVGGGGGIAAVDALLSGKPGLAAGLTLASLGGVVARHTLGEGKASSALIKAGKYLGATKPTPFVLPPPAAPQDNTQQEQTPNYAQGTMGEENPIVYRNKAKGIRSKAMKEAFDMAGRNAMRTMHKNGQHQKSPIPPPEGGKFIGKQPPHGTQGPHRNILDFGQKMRPAGIRSKSHGTGTGWGGYVG
jgi:hypothetical protein